MSQQRTSIGITSADYYISHELARNLLEHQGANFERVVLTVRNPNRVEDIKNKYSNVVVKVIDYQDQNKIVEALRNLDWVILVAEPEDNRVQSSQMIIEAAQQAGVKNVLMQSTAAAEMAQPSMKEFLTIERKLQQTGQNWTILRNQYIQNWFILWSCAVQDRNEFPVTFDPQRIFVPIRLEDIVSATYEIVSKKDIGRNRAQTYTLTGPQKLSGTDLVKKLNEALEFKDKNQVQIRRVQRADMEKYLNDLRESSQHRGRLGPSLEGQPTQKQIQTILDLSEWINSGQAEMQTDHLRQLIGSNGENIQRFFEDNKRNFR